MADFTLELLHFSDQEAGVPALKDAPNFSAVLGALKLQDLGNDGLADNTLVLSSGDAIIPGLFLSASRDVYGGVGRADILIQNELGVQAIAFGNHEFDLGTAVVRDLIAGNAAAGFPGTAFPYLSANLNFSTDTNLASLVVPNALPPLPNSIAASTVIDVNGEKIGVVGATTPTIRTISSPGGVTIFPSPFGGVPTDAELDALAAEIQADVDALLAANPDVDKVVLLSHMQQIAIEQALAERLSHVDIIVAGGSNTRLFDETDRARAGDSTQGVYPIIKTDADGNPVAVVNTDGNYKYVGRLVIDFDANGVIIPESYDSAISGAYATDAQGVADLGAEGLVDPEIQAIVDALEGIIVAKESNIFGVSNVFLEGRRPAIRQQETNLGNLTADANLAIAKEADPTVTISLKNGGGIRNTIGRVVIPTGSTGEAVFLPNEAVTDAQGNVIKPEGGISETDIANALSFNNGLSLVTVTATELLALLEHGVAASTLTNEQGRFPQVSGVSFSFDLNAPAGDRIQTLAIKNEDGTILDVVVANGELIGDPSRTFRMVTLNFLAGGGDGYPFPQGAGANRVDLTQPSTATPTGNATFAADGSEQDALAEYLFANFLNTPYDIADTGRDLDTRLQNLAFRNDAVLGENAIAGTDSGDLLVGDELDNTLYAFGGNDTVAGSLGNDAIFGGDGDDILRGDRNSRNSGGKVGGNDIIYGGAGNDRIGGKAGNDALFGGDGDDQIWGDDGDDLIYGGNGNNTLVGDNFSRGTGNDIFVLAAGDVGLNTILDYGNGDDQIGLAKGLTLGSITTADVGGDAQIFNDGTLVAIVKNTAAADLSFVTVDLSAYAI